MAEDVKGGKAGSQLGLNDKPRPKTASEQLGELITYLPGPQDPPSVKWNGVLFHANTPKLVTSEKHIEMARGNRFFKVGAFESKDAVPTREEDHPSPKTPEQYRTHAVAWFKTAQNARELDDKWIAEESLRETCGVGTDDLDYLMSLFMPKRAELHKIGFPT